MVPSDECGRKRGKNVASSECVVGKSVVEECGSLVLLKSVVEERGKHVVSSECVIGKSVVEECGRRLWCCKECGRKKERVW